MENDDFGMSEEYESDFEGEGVESYLPRADPELSHVENSEVMEEDEEPMDFDNIVLMTAPVLVMRVLLSL